MNQTPISLYKSALDNKGTQITVSAAIQLIRSGKYEKQIKALRKVLDPNENAELKKKLPAVTWSGTFSKRGVTGLIEYSGLICIDIDKLSPKALVDTREVLTSDPYVYFMFVSPNGNGLKVLIRTIGTSDQHKDLFTSIERYFKEKYDVTIDKSCKDVSRLCFLSSDMYAIDNEDSAFYNNYEIDLISNQDKTPSKKSPPAVKPPSGGLGVDLPDFAAVKIFPDKKATYEEGNRNNYIFLYASNCNRKGYPEADCLNYILSAFSDFPAAEVPPIVANAYTKNKNEHAKYAKSFASGTGGQSFDNSRLVAPSPDRSGFPAVDDSVLFWDEFKQKSKFDKKKDITVVKYSFDRMIAFLSNNGFYKYSMKKGSFVLIRVQNNIVEVVEDKDIIFFVLEYLESEPVKFEKIRELFRQKIGTYMDIKQLVQLPYLPYTIKKLDTPDTAYVYFNNVYLRITKDQIETKTYDQLEGHIWGRQRIDFDYTDPGTEVSVIDDFFWCAITGRKPRAEGDDGTDIEKVKMKSVYTSVGYMLHRYKNPTLTKAVIATDKQLRDGNDSNGGTGKSLMGKILARFLNVCNIEGKMFRFDAPRPFETLKPDHSLINFNDVRKNFDFEGLYGLLTDDFTYAVIYKEPVTLSFDDSPKVFISTNYSIKGEGNSMIRRQQLIEFSNFFTPSHQPSDEFKHMFFYDWAKPEYQKEWPLFYRFMITCIQYYLRFGLVDFPLENYGTNKMIDTAGEEVLDWCEDVIVPLIGDGRQDKHLLFNAFRVAIPHKDKTQINSFTKWIKTFCKLRQIAINAHLEPDSSGNRRDKSGNAEYWTFSAINQLKIKI